MNRVLSHAFVFLIVTGITLSSSFAVSRLAIGPSSGTANSTGALAIQFDTTAVIAGLQIDLVFNPLEVEFPDPPTLSAIHDSHSINGSVIEAGRYRLIVVALAETPIRSGELATLPIRFKQTIPETSQAVTLSEVMVSNRYGLESSFSFSPFVALNGLTPGMEVAPGQSLPIEAVAFGFESDLQRLEVLINGQLVGVSSSAPFSATWTPIEPGAVLVTAIARDASGQQVIAPGVEVNVPGELLESYDAWRAFFFTPAEQADPSLSGPTADFDKDGTLNIFEFLSGTNPKATERLGDSFEHATINDGGQEFLTLTVVRRSQLGDTTLKAISSNNLAFLDTAEAVPVSFEQLGDFQRITFRDTIPISDTERRFIRVELDYTPSAP